MTKIESSNENREGMMERGEPGTLLGILHNCRARQFNWIFIYRTPHCMMLTKPRVKHCTAKRRLAVSRPQPTALAEALPVPYCVGLPDRSAVHTFSGNVPSLYWFSNNCTYEV